MVWIVAYNGSHGDRNLRTSIDKLKNAPGGPNILIVWKKNYEDIDTSYITPTTIVDDTNYTSSDVLVGDVGVTVDIIVKKILTLCNSTITKNVCRFKSQDDCKEDLIYTPQANLDPKFLKFCSNGTETVNCSSNESCSDRRLNEENRVNVTSCNATCGNSGWMSTIPANLGNYCTPRSDPCTGPQCTTTVATTATNSVGLTPKQPRWGIWPIVVISIASAAVLAAF